MTTAVAAWVTWWLEHRTPERKAWARFPIPPNTLRIHTEHVLVKSGGLKVLFAESRVQGTGQYCRGGDIGDRSHM
ncbi:hypothetical protein TNCV_1944991 [Trichonephila clavipes]|nr:hypothetical protein TNCV_1944991 [Trichonephila clavipes]